MYENWRVCYFYVTKDGRKNSKAWEILKNISFYVAMHNRLHIFISSQSTPVRFLLCFNAWSISVRYINGKIYLFFACIDNDNAVTLIQSFLLYDFTLYSKVILYITLYSKDELQNFVWYLNNPDNGIRTKLSPFYTILT